jgi:NAD(P)-dependent dehydrogenase (short-subunit alcohol dehydrogenase family)
MFPAKKKLENIKMKKNSRIVLVNGGTGGLGSAVVKKFLKAESEVFVSYSRKSSFEKLVNELGYFENLYGVQADLRVEDQVQNLFHEILKQNGKLHILCHLTGGFWMRGALWETPLAKWNNLMDLNLLTTFLATKEAFKIMRNQEEGKIFTVSARTALELPGGMGAYSVSKAAILALTEVLAKEGKEFNIQVNTLLPSIINTEANRKDMSNADYSKWVSPEEIADVIFALSDQNFLICSGSKIKVYGKA